MAGETYRYNVVISASLGTRGVTAGADAADREMTRMEKRAQKLQSQFEKLSKAIDVATAANERASRVGAGGSASRRWTDEERAINKASSILNKYENQIDRLKGQDSELKRLNRTLSQDGVAKNIDETTKALLREKAAVIDNIKESQRLQKEQEKAARERANTSQRRIERSQTVGSGMQSAGIGMTAAITAPAVAGFAKAIEIGSQYEQSMNLFGAVTNATAAEMQAADETAIKLGNDLRLPGVSAKDAAEAMTELGKAGMTAAESMEAAQGTLQLSTAANITAAQAAEITANALNMFGLRAGEAGRIADLLAGAANASSAEITDIAASLQQAGAVFANAKVPIEDVVALVAELANQGIKGSDAGTSLKTMMQRLQSPTDNAAAALKALNVEIYDQSGAMRPMRDIIGQFENSLKGLSQQQKDQALNTIFGSDAVRAATIVFGQGADGFDKIKEAVMRANAAQDLAAARTKGLAGSWEAFTSQLETFGLIVYNRIKAPLTEFVILVATVFGQVTDAFSALPEGIQTAILAIVAVASAIGPVLAVIGTLVVALGSVASGLTALAGTATVGAALTALAPIVAAITAVIVGLTAGVTAAIGVVWGLAEAWKNGFGPIASIVAVGVAAIMSFFSPIIGLPVLIGAVLVTLYEVWETNFGGMRDFAMTVWVQIVKVTETAMVKLNELANAVGGRFIAWWRENYPLIQGIVQTVNSAIQNAIQYALDWIAAFWQAHGSKILTVVTFIWNRIKSFMMFAVNTVLDIVTTVLQLLNGRWEDAWHSVLRLTRRAVGYLIATINDFGKLFIGAVVKIAAWLFTNAGIIVAKVSSIVVSGLKYLVGVVAMLPAVLHKLVPKFISAGMSLGSAIWQGIKEGLNGGGEGPAIDTLDLNSVFPSFNPEAPSVIDTLTNGFDNFKESIKGTTGELNKHNKSLGDFTDRAGKAAKAQREQNDELTVTSGTPSYDALYLKFAKKYNLDPNILLEQGRTESVGFSPAVISGNRKSRKGAIGIAQFMPDTAAEMGVDPYDVTSSISGQARLMRRLLNKYGSYELALAAYNSGHNKSKEQAQFALDNFKETKKYVPKILNAARAGRGGGGMYGLEGGEETKSFAQLADENIMNNAKQRVQNLVQLARELNVELTVPEEVTTSNQELIYQQERELKLLNDLKDKRQQVGDLVIKFNLDQANYQRETIAMANESLGKLKAMDDAQQFVNSTYEDSTKRLSELRAEAQGTLAPLEEFNRKFEELWKKSGLNREEFDRLNPKLAETRNLLQNIADTDLANKASAKIKALGEDISKEILNLQREAKAAGLTPDQRKAFDRENEIEDFLKDAKIVSGGDLGSKVVEAYIRSIYKKKQAAEDAAAASQKVADATKLYNDELESINDSIRDHLQLTDAQKLEYELTTGKLKDLTAEQKENLRIKQKELEQAEQVRQLGDSFGQIFADSFTALFEEGVSGSLRTLGQGLKDFFFDIVGTIANAIKKKISDAIVQAIGIGTQGAGSSGGGGGGIFGSIISGVMNIFNPSKSSSSGGSSSGTGSRMAAEMGKAVDTFGKTNIGEDIPAFTSNNRSTALGGATRAIEGGSWYEQNREILERIRTTEGAGGSGGTGLGSNGYGSQVIQTAGGAMASLGSLFMSAGPAMAFTFAAQMFMESLQTHSPTVGALKGGLVGMIAGFLNRNRRRKREEKVRSTAILDAFSAIDQLIKDIDNDSITDPKAAMSQFTSIRTSYMDQMSQLKDKKTRNHALADVSRIDERKKYVEAAITRQQNREVRRAQLAPTFADGGSVSGFISSNYRNNPLGYINGPGTSRSDSIPAYFPEADSFARISNSEYVLDAVTTRNIGVGNLDAIRADRGRNFRQAADLMNRLKSPGRFADGGAIRETGDPGFFSSPAGTNPSAGSGISVEVVNNLYPTEGGATIETEVYLKTPQGKELIEKIVEEKIYENKKSGRIPTAIAREFRS